jgi:hypothetical protein
MIGAYPLMKVSNIQSGMSRAVMIISQIPFFSKQPGVLLPGSIPFYRKWEGSSGRLKRILLPQFYFPIR